MACPARSAVLGERSVAGCRTGPAPGVDARPHRARSRCRGDRHAARAGRTDVALRRSGRRCRRAGARRALRGRTDPRDADRRAGRARGHAGAPCPRRHRGGARHPRAGRGRTASRRDGCRRARGDRKRRRCARRRHHTRAFARRTRSFLAGGAGGVGARARRSRHEHDRGCARRGARSRWAVGGGARQPGRVPACPARGRRRSPCAVGPGPLLGDRRRARPPRLLRLFRPRRSRCCRRPARHAAGRMCALVGVALELAGAWWMHRILRNGAAV